MRFKTLLFVLLLYKISYSQTYFVAPNSPKILSEDINKPGDFIYAINNVSEGSKIFVKAGIYDTNSIIIKTSNISLIGYSKFPNDLSNNKISQNFDNYYNYNYDSIFPLFDFLDRKTNKIAFLVIANNVIIKNLQVRNVRVGFKLLGNGNVLENIIAINFGDINNSYSGTAISSTGNRNLLKNIFILNAAAEGISIMGDSNKILKCNVYCTDTLEYSETDYFINISPNYQTFQSIGNIIDSCYIEKNLRRIPHTGHLGHGFCLNTRYFHKPCDDGEGYCYDSTLKNLVLKNNIIQNSISKNIFGAFFLRGDGTKYNTIKNCKSLSIGYIELNASCSYNLFENCYIKDTYYFKDNNSSSLLRSPGVMFASSYFGQSNAQNCPSIEGNSYPWQTQYGPYHNIFVNCIFENVASAISNSEYSDFEYPNYHALAEKPTDRKNRKIIFANQFIHCNFIAKKLENTQMSENSAFFLSMRGNSKNKIVNSLIYGFTTFESRCFPNSYTKEIVEKHGLISANYEFSNCVFYNNYFDSNIKFDFTSSMDISPLLSYNNYPNGKFTNCYTGISPDFFDFENSDFHLLNSSICIDNGIETNINFDFENNKRELYSNPDIGAFEFIGQKIENNNVLLYPNPTKYLLIVNNYNIQDTIRIYNIIGNLVYEGNKKNIDVHDFPKGLYIVVVGKYSMKFVKE